ncbi:MAG: pyridoxamine 5'-phosphate oxidase family protein, partial [Clostridia bacterium]|nr:pyridoxamine 5'-phosphate oxidase family protein [Clostridia bacterium]
EGYVKDGEWARNIRSVVVFGKIKVIDDYDTVVSVSQKLSRKFTDDETYIEKEIKAFASKTLILELTLEHICGKAVTES